MDFVAWYVVFFLATLIPALVPLSNRARKEGVNKTWQSVGGPTLAFGVLVTPAIIALILASIESMLRECPVIHYRGHRHLQCNGVLAVGEEGESAELDFKRKAGNCVGLTKRLMELCEAQLGEASNIAVEAGALKRCELHPDVVWDAFGDPSVAYRISNVRFTAGELQTDFASRRELTDAIKEAIDESGLGGCWLCERMLAD